jgi:segregation and condensation protein B
MNESYIKNVIEAALLAAGRPLQIVELTQLFEESDLPEAAAIRSALDSLEADYVGRGIEVKETATGYRIQVRRDLANEISRLCGIRARCSRRWRSLHIGSPSRARKSKPCAAWR